MSNADLRKKLRVDRIRKMTMGNGQPDKQGVGNVSSVVEDPSQPDWKKYKTLQEIDMIRQTKKDMIINQVMGNFMTDSKMVSVIPGDISFVTMPIQNDSQETKVYQIAIHDPDVSFLETQEVSMVYSQVELEHWARKEIIRKPQSFDFITSTDTIILQPSQRIELLFKFQTFREASLDPNVLSSIDVIKQRSVRIVCSMNGQVHTQMECNMNPGFAPVDHVFRYYEPEHSYFKVKIPPFLQFNQRNLFVKVSKPSAQVELEQKTSEIHVSSKTTDSMKIVDLTVYLYSDGFMSDLLAVCKVEVTPLSCMYSQTRAGVQNNISLALPAGESRIVEIHSSNSKNVYLPKRSIDNKFHVISNSINHVSVHTKTYTPDQKRVVINAIGK